MVENDLDLRALIMIPSSLPSRFMRRGPGRLPKQGAMTPKSAVRPTDTSNPLRGAPADEARYGSFTTYEVRLLAPLPSTRACTAHACWAAPAHAARLMLVRVASRR